MNYMNKYIDKDVYNLELKKVFKNSWLLLCHVSIFEKINQVKIFKVFGEEIILVKSADSVIGFYNICPHRGCQFAQNNEVLSSNVFTCPYHGWEFDLSGDVSKITGRDKISLAEKNKYKLIFANIKVVEGFIFFSSNAEPEIDTTEIFNTFMNEFSKFNLGNLSQIGRSYKIRVNSNWKHLVENNLEGYHIKHAHPGLYSLYNDRYPVESFDLFTRTEIELSSSVDTMSSSERLYLEICNKYYGFKTIKWIYLTVFPSLTFEIYPEQIVFFQYIPNNISSTDIYVTYLGKPNSDRIEIIARYLNFRMGRKTFLEDKSIVEKIQIASASQFFPISNFEQKEKVLEHFYRTLESYLR